jgi:hypothetical protein
MKNLYSILLVFLLLSCASKPDNPIIIPPNFSEMPDPNNPEKLNENQKEESVERLKELLLKSD